MNTIDRILEQAKSKYSSNADLERALGLKSKTINNWLRGKSKTYFKLLPQIAEKLGVDVISLLGDDVKENYVSLPFVINGNQAREYVAKYETEFHKYTLHDNVYLYAKHKVGKEDTDLMFKVANIPLDDSDYVISDEILNWIGSHCEVYGAYFNEGVPITLAELEEPYYLSGGYPIEELIENPYIAKLEEEFNRQKCEKYAAIEREMSKKSYNGYKREIMQNFEEIINQFDGDLGTQFVLLDRFRQLAKELASEVALRKEEA